MAEKLFFKKVRPENKQPSSIRRTGRGGERVKSGRLTAAR